MPDAAEDQRDLVKLAWPDVEARAGSSILALPVGSTEQHGPHLPLSTDTDIAEALARRLAARVDRVLVAPPVAYGSSGEHAGFAGTLSIGQSALQLLLVELCRSADAFAGIVIVSAHGGNASAVSRAVNLLRGEGRNVSCWSPSCVDARDSHAGKVETSVLLALGSRSVRQDRVRPGEQRPLAELMPLLRSGGVASVSPSGVLGDPSGATAEYGTELLDAWTDDLVEAVRSL